MSIRRYIHQLYNISYLQTCEPSGGGGHARRDIIYCYYYCCRLTVIYDIWLHRHIILLQVCGILTITSIYYIGYESHKCYSYIFIFYIMCLMSEVWKWICLSTRKSRFSFISDCCSPADDIFWYIFV